MSEQATHYLLEIRNCKVVKRYAMTEEDYHIVLDGLERTSTMRTIMEGFICFHEALKELETWCCEAPQNGEYLTRNLHTAERLCRGVLFEYRSFLSLGRLIPRHFIVFDATVNGIVFLISLSDRLLFVSLV